MDLPRTPPPTLSQSALPQSEGTLRVERAPRPRVLPRLGECPVCREDLGAPASNGYRSCDSCGTSSARQGAIDVQDGYHFHDLEITEPNAATTLQRLDHLEAGLARAAQLENRPGRLGQERILHLGCGRGTLVESARAAGHDAWGLDVSAPALRACERRGVGPRCRLVPSLTEAPEGWAGRFDAVLAVDLIEHYERPLEIFQAARRYLRPGGWLIGTTRNGRSAWRGWLGDDWPGVTWPQYHPTLLDARGIQTLAGILSAGPVWTESLCDRGRTGELLEARVVRDSRAPRTNLRRNLLTAALWPSEWLRQRRAGKPGGPEGDTLRFGVQI